MIQLFQLKLFFKRFHSKSYFVKLAIILAFCVFIYVLIRFSDHKRLESDVIPDLDYNHLFQSFPGEYKINNSLIIRQGPFIVPNNNTDLLKRHKFEILPSFFSDKMDDRIYSQMRYVPMKYVNNSENVKEKLILLYVGAHYIDFENLHLCPVSKCKITTDRKTALVADVILWIRELVLPKHQKPLHQIWALLLHEPPYDTPYIKEFESRTKSMINWTITYRPDSTIPHPYHKYSPYDLINPPPEMYPLPKKDYSSGKTKMVAWFVSNCHPNNDRNQIVKNLQLYIDIDIYGRCGPLKCPRRNRNECLKLLDKNYKFYLSFENSYCRHYITEKFFLNGLSHDVIPVVLGAHPADYKNVAPPHSYIHIDDFLTIKDLADYMKYLDRNHTAYNEYFAWKSFGTVNFEQHFYCRLCMMAHAAENMNVYYTSIHRWWHSGDKSMCFNKGNWKTYAV